MSHALRASGHAERVTAADLNPRAAAYTELNAKLNEIGNIETVGRELFSDYLYPFEVISLVLLVAVVGVVLLAKKVV